MGKLCGLPRHSGLWLIEFYGIFGSAVNSKKGKLIFNY